MHITADNTNFGIAIKNVCRLNIVTSNIIDDNKVGINVSSVSDGNYFYSFYAGTKCNSS
jgi:hypothetical protein